MEIDLEGIPRKYYKSSRTIKRKRAFKCQKCKKSSISSGHHFLCVECWEKKKEKRLNNDYRKRGVETW